MLEIPTLENESDAYFFNCDLFHRTVSCQLACVFVFFVQVLFPQLLRIVVLNPGGPQTCYVSD